MYARAMHKVKRGIVARFQAAEDRNAAAGDFVFIYATKDLATGTKNLPDQMGQYNAMFDQFKVLRIVRKVWLEQSDEETEANLVMPRLRWCYDPDNFSSRVIPFEDMGRLPNARTVFLRPGIVKSFSFVPQFSVRAVQPDGTYTGEALYGALTRGWQDTSAVLTTNPTKSANAVVYSTHGGGSAFEKLDLIYKDIYIIAFRNRRNNVKYKAT
jgi:hypothetical protein